MWRKKYPITGNSSFSFYYVKLFTRLLTLCQAVTWEIDVISVRHATDVYSNKNVSTDCEREHDKKTVHMCPPPPQESLGF